MSTAPIVPPVPVQVVTELSQMPIFELTYKHGHIKQDVLFQEKDLNSAIELGNKFCKAARLRFITVTPFIKDLRAMLDKLEKEGT